MTKVTKLLEAIAGKGDRKSQLDSAIKSTRDLLSTYQSDTASKVFKRLEKAHGELVAIRAMMNSESEDLGTPGGAPESGW